MLRRDEREEELTKHPSCVIHQQTIFCSPPNQCAAQEFILKSIQLLLYQDSTVPVFRLSAWSDDRNGIVLSIPTRSELQKAGWPLAGRQEQSILSHCCHLMVKSDFFLQASSGNPNMSPHFAGQSFLYANFPTKYRNTEETPLF